QCPAHTRDLPSFPTRRSSDLYSANRSLVSPSTLMPAAILSLPLMLNWLAGASGSLGTSINPPPPPQAASHRLLSNITTGRTCDRSEEHTSELQSRENLVCRLL